MKHQTEVMKRSGAIDVVAFSWPKLKMKLDCFRNGTRPRRFFISTAVGWLIAPSSFFKNDFQFIQICSFFHWTLKSEKMFSSFSSIKIFDRKIPLCVGLFLLQTTSEENKHDKIHHFLFRSQVTANEGHHSTLKVFWDTKNPHNSVQISWN